MYYVNVNITDEYDTEPEFVIWCGERKLPRMDEYDTTRDELHKILREYGYKMVDATIYSF